MLGMSVVQKQILCAQSLWTKILSVIGGRGSWEPLLLYEEPGHVFGSILPLLEKAVLLQE